MYEKLRYFYFTFNTRKLQALHGHHFIPDQVGDETFYKIMLSLRLLIFPGHYPAFSWIFYCQGKYTMWSHIRDQKNHIRDQTGLSYYLRARKK